MGRKPGSVKALQYLIERGIEIAVVVTLPRSFHTTHKERLADMAHYYGIPVANDKDLYNYLSEKDEKNREKYNFKLDDIDLVISYLFWLRIQQPLIDLPKFGCINFHPAPLPDFKGTFGYNHAIYEGLTSWGVSAHHVIYEFDAGDIIKDFRFDIDPINETTISLEQKSQKFLFELFKSVIHDFILTRTLARRVNEGGRYIPYEELKKIRKINFDDPHDLIDRKIRASWYPPYNGAYIRINGKKYSVINEEIIRRIGNLYHRKKL